VRRKKGFAEGWRVASSNAVLFLLAPGVRAAMLIVPRAIVGSLGTPTHTLKNRDEVEVSVSLFD
jgi:hypothetical protein